MKADSKWMLYTVGGVVFLISFVGMLIYGYKTFYLESEPVVSKQYAYHFALIAEETDNDYWRLVEKGARDAARENDIYLEYVAPQKADNEELLNLMDRLIAAKVDGIMTQGVEGQRFVNLVHRAVERGIPVVTVDTDVKSSERKAYVGTDNYLAGQLLGQALLEDTDGEQYVGIVTGRAESINQQERLAGFKAAVKTESRIHIIEIAESNITQIGAMQAAYSLLKQHPKINALVGMSALDGIGIVEGLNEIAIARPVYVVAFDVLPETIRLIKTGDIDATVAQYPEEMGAKAVEVMMGLQQNDLLDNQIFTETRIIRKADISRSGELQ